MNGLNEIKLQLKDKADKKYVQWYIDFLNERNRIKEKIKEDFRKINLWMIKSCKLKFRGGLYGSRSHKNKQIIQQLKEVAKELKWKALK